MADLPEGFDLEALLAPIPGDAPQGADIREDFSADLAVQSSARCAIRGARRRTRAGRGLMRTRAIRRRSGAAFGNSR